MTNSFRVAIAVCLGIVLLLSVSVIAFAGDGAGAAAFQQYCAACHGNNAQGTAYAPNIQGESASDVIETAREGDDSMPAFSKATISDSTLQSIANYVSSLSSAGDDQYANHGGDGDHHRGDGESASGSQYGGHHGGHHDSRRHSRND